MSDGNDLGTGSHEQRISSQVVKALDEQVASIDQITERKLAVARREAIGTGQRSRRFSPISTGWSTALASVAGFLVIMMFWNTPISEIKPDIVAAKSETTLEYIPMLSSTDDLEFYRSVEFLLWMEKNAG